MISKSCSFVRPHARGRPSRQFGRALLAGLALTLFSPGALPGQAAGSGPEEPQKKEYPELDKLYPVTVELRGRPLDLALLRQILARAVRETAILDPDRTSRIKIQFFEKDRIRWRPRGKAALATGRLYRSPDPGDEDRVFKQLEVGSRYSSIGRGAGGFARFRFSVGASRPIDGSRGKKRDFGVETFDFVLVEDTRDGRLRLICDEASYLKRRARVTRNWIPRESESGDQLLDSEEFLAGDDGDEDQDEKESTEESSPTSKSGSSRPPPEITRILDFRLGQDRLEIDFQKVWSRGGRVPVRGTLQVRLNSTLDTRLHFTGLREDGTPGKSVKAAYFTGGIR